VWKCNVILQISTTTMSVVSGILFHATGASCASLCYTPQKKTSAWSWQSYWLVQAIFCWLLLPVLGAWITIPHLSEVLSVAPKDAMYKSFALGAAYGIGGTAFGIAILCRGHAIAPNCTWRVGNDIK
jgi:L-rhamnose-H+ transport protein